MGDEMARALGSNGTTTVMIAGKECTVRPLGIAELAEVERDCLQRYKRQYLQSFADNMDLLPKSRGAELLERKIEEVSGWGVKDLPIKTACDPNRVTLTDALKAWIADLFDLDVSQPIPDTKWKRLVAGAIDQGLLSEDEYKGLTGAGIRMIRVPYPNWWVTGDYEGMITFAWVCFRHNGVTRDQVAANFPDSKSVNLMEAAREIERLSAPQPGNG